MQEVARRHGIGANLLSSWRGKEPVSQTLIKKVKFAAVKMSAMPAECLIEIDLIGGCIRVRGRVDGIILREVLAAAR